MPKPRAARLAVLLAVMLAAFVAIGGKLAYVQVGEASRFAAYGEGQRVHTEQLPAARGAIFDRNGRELAMTVRQATVWANPRAVLDPAGDAAVLAPILGVDAGVLQHRLSKDAAFVYLARTVPDAVAAQVEALGLPGVHLMPEPKRFTPAGDLALPVLGTVGVDNEGLGGIELQFEDRLAGAPGFLVVEQDPAGREIPGGVRDRKPSVRGDDLVLTLDRSLQYETERALADQIVSTGALGGVAVVMDTATGEILALANLQAGVDGGPPRPAASNTALTNVYEPGSVNKLITVAAALEEGITAPDSVLHVPPTIRVADHTFSEHEHRPPVDWTVTEIMAQSSNVGTIMLGQELGKERIDGYLRAFGFGSRTGLGFPGESPGIMLDPEKWSGTSIGTIPIGQGIAVTAIQMLSAYNTVANGGEYVAPKLVKATVGSDGRHQPTPASERRRVVSPRTARQVAEMLEAAVSSGTGTNAAIDGYTVAGKTGTARKPLENARGYKPGAYVSSFAGFVPADRPALTAMVMLDEPTPIYGGIVAAPVFAEIVRYGLRELRIPPPARPPAADVEPTTGGEAPPTTLAARRTAASTPAP